MENRAENPAALPVASVVNSTTSFPPAALVSEGLVDPENTGVLVLSAPS